MSTTRGYPACSRSSTTQVVLAPVSTFVTRQHGPERQCRAGALTGRCGGVPRGLAPFAVRRHEGRRTHRRHLWRDRRRRHGNREHSRCCLLRRGRVERVRSLPTSAVVSPVSSPVSEDQPLTVWWNRDEPFRSSPPVKEGRHCRTTRAHLRACDVTRLPPVATRAACADPCCSKRRGAANTAPQRTAATPRRLP